MKEINYLEIIKQSWKITWNHKFLWWFGLFLALGGGSNFNFNIGGNNDWGKNLEGEKENVISFLSSHWQFFAAGIVLVIILMIVLFVLRIISQAGLVKTLSVIDRNEKGSFKIGFRQGKKYFWKLTAVILILFSLITALLVVLTLPIIFIFLNSAYIFGILAALLAIIIFVPLIILASYIGKYASFYIILSELKVRDSIENGYLLFRKNIIPSIIMTLFFIPLSIILTIFFIILFVSIGLIILIPGIILFVTLSKIGIAIVLAIGVFIFGIAILLTASIYQVFSNTIWFLFFKEVATIKEEEKAEEAVEDYLKEKLPAPGEA